VDVDLKQVQELLASFNQTNITELNLKSGALELTLRREAAPVVASAAAVASAAVAPVLLGGSTPDAAHHPPPPPTPGSAPAAANANAPNKKWVEIKSPMVGTFYRSPAPDQDPFVDVGANVRKGQTVCILEAMKLMNEIEAELNGQIVEILVQNGEPVEYEQVLMRINPV
jgi:acetyl-CoA carboxylase biotin carboxyl carrier protein